MSENNLVQWMIRATTLVGGPEGHRPVDLLPTHPDALPAAAEQAFGNHW